MRHFAAALALTVGAFMSTPASAGSLSDIGLADPVVTPPPMECTTYGFLGMRWQVCDDDRELRPHANCSAVHGTDRNGDCDDRERPDRPKTPRTPPPDDDCKGRECDPQEPPYEPPYEPPTCKGKKCDPDKPKPPKPDKPKPPKPEKPEKPEKPKKPKKPKSDNSDANGKGGNKHDRKDKDRDPQERAERKKGV